MTSLDCATGAAEVKEKLAEDPLASQEKTADLDHVIDDINNHDGARWLGDRWHVVRGIGGTSGDRS